MADWLLIIPAAFILVFLLLELPPFIRWHRDTFSSKNRRRRLPRGGSFRSLRDRHERDWARLDAMSRLRDKEPDNG